MRIQASRLKYLAFALGLSALGACFFDPKGGGSQLQNPVGTEDGSTAGTDSPSSASGTGGDGIGVGSSGTGGAGASASGSGGQNVGGMSSEPGGPIVPDALANGEKCTEDARCMSGHCDGVCCDKGSECCSTVADCTTSGGLGMSCDDRSSCRGSAGKITCTGEFKCVTIDGARNDTACSNRVEADDCGLYPSVFCLGGELQQGAPPCATSCASDSDCDLNAHCTDGKCEADKPNGQQCKRPEDCTAGICQNIKNGTGVCCGASGDCCTTAADCPDKYRKAPSCTEPQMCKGSETVAVCMLNNICASMQMPNDAACAGMKGPDCGLYQDIMCMPGRANTCKTNCMNMGDCDANAFCDGRTCVEKKPNGGTCTANMNNQCTSNNCTNGVCCAPGIECCKTADDCKMGLQPRCDDDDACQGSIRRAQCQNSMCTYGERVADDRECKGASRCGAYKDRMCNGMSAQDSCPVTCTSTATDCDSNAMCVRDDQGRTTCTVNAGNASGN